MENQLKPVEVICPLYDFNCLQNPRIKINFMRFHAFSLDYRQEQQDDPAPELQGSHRAAGLANVHRNFQSVRQAYESDSWRLRGVQKNQAEEHQITGSWGKTSTGFCAIAWWKHRFIDRWRSTTPRRRFTPRSHRIWSWTRNWQSCWTRNARTDVCSSTCRTSRTSSWNGWTVSCRNFPFILVLINFVTRSQSHMAPQMQGMRGPPPMVPGMAPRGPPPGMMRPGGPGFPPR